MASAVGLDVNSPYAYVMWGDHFATSSVVAVCDPDMVVGFVTGFRLPRDPETLFVWQVGVAEDMRGLGIGSAMLAELVARTGVRWIEATVTPSNVASSALFRGAAERFGTRVDEVLAYPADLFPPGHEAEVRFRVGPIDRTS